MNQLPKNFELWKCILIGHSENYNKVLYLRCKYWEDLQQAVLHLYDEFPGYTGSKLESIDKLPEGVKPYIDYR